MNQKTAVAVLFGGVSGEHDVSCLSAYSVLTNLDSEKYTVYPIGITEKGAWLLFDGDYAALKDGSWEQHTHPAFIAPDAALHGIVTADGRQIPIDVCFPVLHGIGGEDGTVQGLLELAGIPFVGCAVASSANCMDKIIAKKLLSAAGIPQCAYYDFDARDFAEAPERVLDAVEEAIGYPAFIKPSRAGSSLGIGKAHDRTELRAAITEAARHDHLIVAEEAVNAREIEVAVMGNRDADASCCGEILPCNEFYDFNAKYIDNKSGLAIPAPISEEESARIRTLAVESYHACGCEGLARCDFFIDRDSGAVYLNEINTMPGFTDISMFPKLRMAAGLTYPALIDKLIALALERGAIYA